MFTRRANSQHAQGSQPTAVKRRPKWSIAGLMALAALMLALAGVGVEPLIAKVPAEVRLSSLLPSFVHRLPGVASNSLPPTGFDPVGLLRSSRVGSESESSTDLVEAEPNPAGAAVSVGAGSSPNAASPGGLLFLTGLPALLIVAGLAVAFMRLRTRRYQLAQPRVSKSDK